MGGRGVKFNGERETEFQDDSMMGMYYRGDGKEQEEFFKKNSNAEEIIDNMDRNELREFTEKWVPGVFMRGQQYGGFENMASYDQRSTRVFDKILDQAELRKGIVVNRMSTAELVLGAGNKVGSLDELRAMEGQVVISAGNMSTGAGKVGLEIGSRLSTKGGYDTKSCEYKIHIPAGSKGAGMYICDPRINPDFKSRQREFMMNRDIRLRVGKTTHDTKRDVYVVHLYYEGRLPHNYTHY